MRTGSALDQHSSVGALARVRSVHLVGVGGTGMSGMARLMLARGIGVSGSDPVPTEITERLAADGLRIDHTQDGRCISRATDLVVASAACRDDNPDIAAARRHGVPIIKYAAMLGLLMREGIGVAVAGTHGKTTTTSMLASVLTQAGRSPTYCIGGEPLFSGVNAHAGRGRHFVAEACEFDRSFLDLNPLAAVITNIEADHLDYYRDLDEIVEAFVAFAHRVPGTGVVVANAADESVQRVVDAVRRRAKVIAYAVAGEGEAARPLACRDADIVASDLEVGASGGYGFTVSGGNRELARVQMSVPGRHNVHNATSVYAVCQWLGLSADEIADGLGAFEGVRRRFEVRGFLAPRNGAPSVPLVDDYAHHPTELAATLHAAREAYPDRSVWAVFQPHQLARTLAHMDGFAEALALADRVSILDIYGAREANVETRGPVACRELVDRLRTQGVHAERTPRFGDVLTQLRTELKDDHAVLLIGAGDVTELAELVLAQSDAPRHAA